MTTEQTIALGATGELLVPANESARGEGGPTVQHGKAKSPFDSTAMTPDAHDAVDAAVHPDAAAEDEPQDEELSEPTHFVDAPPQTCETSETCVVSNEEFVAALFHTLPEGASSSIVSLEGDPRTAPPGAWRSQAAPAPTPTHANNYCTISSHRGNERGRLRRTKATFAAQHGVMLDDLGTKVDLDRLPRGVPLSWKIETSPGNYQGGFILAEPLTDAAVADRLMKAIIDAGLCDEGAGGPTARLVRLPQGSNGKMTPAFSCRMVEWAPTRRYSVQELVVGLGLNLTPDGRSKKESTARNTTPREGIDEDGVYIPAPNGNPVIALLKDKGLYKAPLGSGKHDITCPWCSEHTDAVDSGTAYFEPDDGFPFGGFRCHHGHGDRLHIRDLIAFLGVQPADARMRPTIRLVAGAIHRIVDRAERLLADSGRYYQHGGLVAVVQTDPGSKETAIVPTTQPTLVRTLSRLADWERIDGRSGAWVVADPPARHTGILFDSTDYPHLPVLLGISRQPHMREDGSVVTEAGYDRLTARFGVFDAHDFHIPATPTEADARAALAVLDWLIEEVAFDSPVDRAAALLAMLTAACRPGLPTAPGFHVQAHTIGSGKSHLNRVISSLATPQNVAGIAFPRDADEMRKMLIAMLIKSPAVINFDDLDGDIVPSEALKTTLTEEFIGGRLLGLSKDVTCSTRTLFLFSGNNVGPVRDMSRRVLTIHLDPRCENPVTREFKRPHLESEARRDRPRYVSAALTIIRAWISAGSPRAAVKPVGSYGRWSDWCRQPLIWLGLPDPATRLFEQLDQDPDAELLRRMLAGWHAAHGETPMLVRDVVRRATEGLARSGDFDEALRDIAEERGEVNKRRLGWWLKRHAGRIIDGMKFVAVPSGRGSGLWRVQVSPVSPVPSDPIGKNVSTRNDDAEVL